MRWFRPVKIGKIVRLFILADLALLAGWGFISPVLALFIVDRIEGGNEITVGIAVAVYWITKAIVQLPIARFLDKTPSEKDDYLVLILGLVIAGFSALGFIFVTQAWELYLLKFVNAIAFAMYVPAWAGIFSRHLDKRHEAMDWALDNAAVSFSAGVTGLLGGILVAATGFDTIFILGAIFSFISAVIIFSAPEVVFPHRIRHKRLVLRNHRPIPNSN